MVGAADSGPVREDRTVDRVLAGCLLEHQSAGDCRDPRPIQRLRHRCYPVPASEWVAAEAFRSQVRAYRRGLIQDKADLEEDLNSMEHHRQHSPKHSRIIVIKQEIKPNIRISLKFRNKKDEARTNYMKSNSSLVNQCTNMLVNKLRPIQRELTEKKKKKKKKLNSNKMNYLREG